MNNDHYCINESRIATIEEKIKNKRYDLNELKDTLNEQAINISNLATEVTKLATILQETQDSRKEQGAKIDKLENQVIQLNTTLNTLKWVITVAVAMFGGVLVFLITNLIQLIH